MTKISYKTVLITGGASGIGYLSARLFLKKGASQVIIWDVAPEQQLAKNLMDDLGKGKVHYAQVDITDEHSVKANMEVLVQQNIIPDILVNNAGIVVGKDFIEHSLYEIKKTIMVNTIAHMIVTRQWLPEMLKKKEFHIVNVASAASYIGNPRMSVYAASKWAIHGWSESLRLELKALSPDYRVSLINPSYIDTGMFAGVTTHWWLPLLKPEKVAHKLVAAVEFNRKIVRMPFLVKVTPALKGLLPVSWFDAIASWLGVYRSMETFKGREDQQ